MAKFITPETIKLLKNFSSLTHGFSQRNFINPEGEESDLLLGKLNDKNNSSQHRKWFLNSLSIKNTEQIFILNQTHSDKVFVLDDLEKTEKEVSLQDADAIVTHLKNRPIGVLTADCVPIILYDPVNHITGVVHAGRKGTQKRILSKTIAVMKTNYGCDLSNIKLGIGPAIGGCCYEVDKSCISPFIKNFSQWKEFVKSVSGGKFMLDLITANEYDALDAGILAENISRSGHCTSCDNHLWYSYRREGITGRILTVSMLKDK
ncbi:MAG: peptidoglycan editing factor PgeF [Nitrospinales bacterium]